MVSCKATLFRALAEKPCLKERFPAYHSLIQHVNSKK
jgi:hypothetical protein